jgi:hypothetical protein
MSTDLEQRRTTDGFFLDDILLDYFPIFANTTGLSHAGEHPLSIFATSTTRCWPAIAHLTGG